LAESVKGFVVPEMNLGQMSLEVERCNAGKARVIPTPTRAARYMNPKRFIKAILEAAK
jgi:hypothetical protein